MNDARPFRHRPLQWAMPPLHARMTRACTVLGSMLAATVCLASAPDNVDLSGNAPNLAAGVPVVAVDATHSGRIAVAWRFIDPLGGSNAETAGNWVCHLSLSTDHGKTFVDRTVDWKVPALSRCNAPWVGYSARGDLYVAATLTGTPPSHALAGAPNSAGSPPPDHPDGTVGFMRSSDEGRSWSATANAIPSHAIERFSTDSSIPAEARQVPWDGARGAIDASTNALYLSGAFPARPGGSDHSQRFYTLSTDQGVTFGPIRAFGDVSWPERWDGDIAASGGEFVASYVADSTPLPDSHCPCAVVAVSHDGGKTLIHRLLAGTSDFDLDTLVHYPEVALDPRHRRRLAVVLVSAQKTAIGVFSSADDGEHWTRLALAQPGDVTAVTRPALTFTPAGTLVAAWRGLHADGSYDIYAAASTHGTRMGRALEVTSKPSNTPAAWVKTYAVRGDFHTSVAADGTDAHIAWADARNGTDVRLMYARVPLQALVD